MNRFQQCLSKCTTPPPPALTKTSCLYAVCRDVNTHTGIERCVMYRSSFRTFPSYLNSRAHSTLNTWTTLWSFRRFSSKTQSSFILSTTNWTIEVFIPYFYIYPKRNVLFECNPINSLTVQKSVSQKSQNRLFFIKKIYHKNRHKETPFLQGENETYTDVHVTIKRFPRTDSLDNRAI